jgi:hypothetical protein
MSYAEPSEVHLEPSTPPPAVPMPAPVQAPPAAPAVPRKTLADWRKAKPHWLFDAACIAAGWTVAQRLSADPLTYTEAEYDAGLKLAGDTSIGGHVPPPRPSK